MFSIETNEIVDRTPIALEQFCLYINNTNRGTTITQMEVDNQQNVKNPRFVTPEQVIEMLVPATKEAPKAMPRTVTDSRILFEDSNNITFHYRPSKNQKLFYKHSAHRINARFPFPSLIFTFNKKTRSLYVAALRFHKRPTAESRVYFAPLPNVGHNANVCLGSVSFNPEPSLDEIAETYLNSYKTHLNNTLIFRKGKSSNTRFYQWAKQCVKTNKCPLSDLAIYGNVESFIQKTTTK
ncbi:hypothetical protein ACP3V3_01715 [Vibrio sp. PNB22_3_1]